MWPVTFEQVLQTEARIRPHLPPTAQRSYPALDEAIGGRVSVVVKHENHNPTNSFKVRNGVALISAMDDAQRRRGVIAATRGNHGLGLAWAGARFGTPVTVCVPHDNNPEKNRAMRGLGAELIEVGCDYDEALAFAIDRAECDGLHLAHSTNDPAVICGAATLSLELLEAEPELDAMVIAVGGGSQAVGAMTVARELAPRLEVYAVQALGACAAHDSYHSGERVTQDAADTIADGLATRATYDLTFPALREGLRGFVAVSDRQIAAAVRLLLETTHNLVEPAGAAGLAGLIQLREQLAGKRVGVVLSGSNIDAKTLRRIVDCEI